MLIIRKYQLGRYERTLKRSLPIPEVAALSIQDRAWVETQGIESPSPG